MNRKLSHAEARVLAASVLGVPVHAAIDEARSAWRELVLSTHPDRGGDAASFEAVQVAWDVWQRTAPEPAPPVHREVPRVIRQHRTRDFGVHTARLPDLDGRASA